MRSKFQAGDLVIAVEGCEGDFLPAGVIFIVLENISYNTYLVENKSKFLIPRIVKEEYLKAYRCPLMEWMRQ